MYPLKAAEFRKTYFPYKIKLMLTIILRTEYRVLPRNKQQLRASKLANFYPHFFD